MSDEFKPGDYVLAHRDGRDDFFAIYLGKSAIKPGSSWVAYISQDLDACGTRSVEDKYLYLMEDIVKRMLVVTGSQTLRDYAQERMKKND